MIKKEIIFSLFLILISSFTTFHNYTFINDNIIISDNWTYNLDYKSEYWEISGRIMTYKYYEIEQSFDLISPLDILLGTGVVADNPDTFNLNYEWGDRCVTVSYIGESDIVTSNLGNIHLIARTSDIFDSLMNVENNTFITIGGYLVDVYGTNVTHTITLETDTEFGNEECEILLVTRYNDIFYITSQQYMLILVILIVIIISVIALTISITLYKKKKKKIRNKMSRYYRH